MAQTAALEAVTAPLDERAAAYPAIIRTLSFIDERWRDQPSLAEIAEAADLSPFHLQRLFTRWTGVSPKRFVGALTHAEARAMLEDGASVLDAALNAGLSGPSRLHDVFIAEEAATPGEVKRGGDGVAFSAGVAPTPFGAGVFLWSARGLSGLAFADEGEEPAALADLAGRFPKARVSRDDAGAARWAARIFDAAPGEDPIPLALYGTPWRRQVWRALLAIPPGRVTSYRRIAQAVCTAKASRAVGAAVGANPVSWLIPCHRVLASDGRLTGYHWGVSRKRAMLAYEAARD